MTGKAIQDYYTKAFSHCYGCGYSNADGHQLKSYWDGDSAVARYQPLPGHIAVPGFVYGGLIASLIDCHGIATAAAAACSAAGCDLGAAPVPRFVTASLHVDYLAPTPTGAELHLRGAAHEVKERKVIVDLTMCADETVCARGRVIAVLIPGAMLPSL
jgi:acyl-coenzyme A thioesterase PaaI-like protein